MSGTRLTEHPLHLGLGATAEIEPLFTGEMSWYEGYGQRHAEDGLEGRLVSMHSFTEPWEVWEVHPQCQFAGAWIFPRDVLLLYPGVLCRY